MFVLLSLTITIGCGRIGFERLSLDSGETERDSGASADGEGNHVAPAGGAGGAGRISTVVDAGDAEMDAAEVDADPIDVGINAEGTDSSDADANEDAALADADTDAFVDPCPGDTDLDGDDVCDAVDLELQTVISSVVMPIVSLDEDYLFAVRSDGNGVIAYDISSSDVAVDPVWIGEVLIDDTDWIEIATVLADGRIAISSGPDGSEDVGRIRVYAFDGSNFSLEEDINTTDIRIYEMIYDPATDRFFWTGFDPTESIHYYELETTPLGYAGMGTSLGSFSEQGTYGLFLDGNILYKARGLIEIIDASTGAIINSFPTDGSHTSWGHGNIDKYGDYLFIIDKWFTPINFSVIDVSSSAEASQIQTIELSQTASPVVSSFSLRVDAQVAIAADSESGLHVIDLSQLPDSLTRIQQLDSTDLDGLVPAGGIDCTQLCCYADAVSGEIMVLCP